MNNVLHIDFRRGPWLAAASALAIASLHGVCFAQDTAPPATAATDATHQTGIADIVVTAQRRSESAQRAAVPISVISAASLSTAGVVSVTNLNAAVPSLVVQKAGGANTIYYIRGVGNFTVNAYADPAIAFNVDGIYYGRPTSTVGTFYDIDRVEVLKGPQGTLYGRNATGGAINVIPTKPKYGETSGYVTANYGRFNDIEGEGAINLPMGDKAAIRISGNIIDRDGYYNDGTNDEVGHAIRFQMMGEVTDTLTARFAADYSHQGGVGAGASFNGIYSFAPGAPATPTSVANYVYTPAPANLGPFEGLMSPASRAYNANAVIGGAFIHPGPALYPSLDDNFYGALLELNWKTPIGTVTFIPAYRDSKLNNIFNGPNFAGGIIKEHDEQFSSELRLAGERTGAFDWLIGAYYFDEGIAARYTYSQYQINSYQRFTTGTKSYAAFGRLVWHVGDRFRLVGGARYTHDSKHLDTSVQTLVEICRNAPPPFGPGCFANNSGSIPAVNSLQDLPGAPVLPGPAGAVPYGTAGNLIFYNPFTLKRSESFGKMTYRAAAEFDVAPNSLLYASYETGFRSGGFSNTIGHETFDPEYLTAYTIGSKNRFLDNKVQANLELFYWKYRNQQVSHFGFDANNQTSLFTENLGRSTIKGFDFDLQVRPVSTTLLRGNVQYLDNRIDSFAYNIPRGGTNLPPVTGCGVSNGTVGTNLVYVINCSGTVGFNSPKWSVNLGFDQTLPLGDYKIVLTGDMRYRGNRVTGFERLAQQNSGADTTFDASATFSPESDRWFISGYIRNITDKVVAVATQYGGTTGGNVSTIYAMPRSYGVRAGVKF